MKTIKCTLIVTLSSLFLNAVALRAEPIHLADGTALEGELAPPDAVLIRTAAGERTVAFALLPAELQKVYWNRATPTKAEPQPLTGAPVLEEELTALANEVNLETWSQIAAFGSFRDKPEKRGTGGLVVTKAFNAIEENWTSVYQAKDAVGLAGEWNAQLARAHALEARPLQFVQKRWLAGFIKAAEAIAARDSNQFALVVRDMKKGKLAAELPRNLFTAK